MGDEDANTPTFEFCETRCGVGDEMLWLMCCGRGLLAYGDDEFALFATLRRGEGESGLCEERNGGANL